MGALLLFLKRLPLIATSLVIAAVVIMIWLGVWQLGRSDEKATMLARYAAAGEQAEPVEWPTNEKETTERLYRKAEVTCSKVTDLQAVAGTSDRGSRGWAQMAECDLEGGGEARIALGWTRDPQGPPWNGGKVEGIIAPGPRLVADPPRAGLLPLAKPDPSELPNNHLAYAWQWFLFALTALVIYGFAVRKKLRDTRDKDDAAS